MKNSPEYYKPDEKGKYVECDKWIIVGGKVEKCGRHVIPLSMFGSQPTESVMQNLKDVGDNPVRVSLIEDDNDGCTIKLSTMAVIFIVLILILSCCNKKMDDPDIGSGPIITNPIKDSRCVIANPYSCPGGEGIMFHSMQVIDSMCDATPNGSARYRVKYTKYVNGKLMCPITDTLCESEIQGIHEIYLIPHPLDHYLNQPFCKP